MLSSTIFGGVSGSAVADASAIGSLLIPWQKRLGYPPAFSAAHAGRGGDDRHPDPAVDPDDPVRAGEQHLDRGAVRRRHPAGPADVRRLHGRVLVGGPPPQLPARDAPLDWPVFRKQLALCVARADAAGADRRSSCASASPRRPKSRVLSTLFAGLVSALVYRDLGLKRLHAAVVEAGLATGVVLLVIMASAAIGWLLTFDRMPDGIVAWAQANLSSAWTVILLMNLLMLAVRHVHRPAGGRAAADAGVRAARQRDRHGPDAARNHDDREPGDRPVHAAGGHHAVHHQRDRQGQGRRDGARARARSTAWPSWCCCSCPTCRPRSSSDPIPARR